MTSHPQQEDPADILYICSLEDLNCLHDYFMASINGEDLTAVPRLWNQQIGIIRSRPAPAPQAPFPEDTEVELSCGSLEDLNYKKRINVPWCYPGCKLVSDHDAAIRNQTIDKVLSVLRLGPSEKKTIESLRTQEHQ